MQSTPLAGGEPPSTCAVGAAAVEERGTRATPGPEGQGAGRDYGLIFSVKEPTSALSQASTTTSTLPVTVGVKVSDSMPLL